METFFSKLTHKRLRRGVLRSVKELKGAIYSYIQQHNDDPNPLIWTAQLDRILDRVSRVNLPSGSAH